MLSIDNDILLLIGTWPVLIVLVRVLHSRRDVLKDVNGTLLPKLIFLSFVVILLYVHFALQQAEIILLLPMIVALDLVDPYIVHLLQLLCRVSSLG